MGRQHRTHGCGVFLIMAFSYCSDCRKYFNNSRCPDCGSFDLEYDEPVTVDRGSGVQINIKKEGNDYHGKKRQGWQTKKSARNKSK